MAAQARNPREVEGTRGPIINAPGNPDAKDRQQSVKAVRRGNVGGSAAFVSSASGRRNPARATHPHGSMHRGKGAGESAAIIH
jgi:hypothetical protein